MMIETKQKTRQLKILLLEDSPADAEMIAGRLRQDGIAFTLRTVDNGEAFERELAGVRPDIILADYHLPLFDGPGALDFTRENYSDIPFIFVTGTIGEEKAVETLQNGATDFVLKGNLARLAPAVLRAVRESRRQRERHSLFAALKDNEERYSSLIENLPVGIFRSTATQPGRLLLANLALARMLGIDSVEKLIQLSLADLYADPEERSGFLADIKERGFVKGREIRFKTVRSDIIWGSMTAACHRNAGGAVDWIEGIIEDVTAKKDAHESLRANFQLLETLIDTINSPVFYKDTRGVFLGCNRSFASMIIGLPREKIIGTTVFDMPEVIPRELAEKYDAKDRDLLDNPGVQVYEAMVRCADDVMRHFHFSKATFPGADGSTAGIVGVMLDITERAEAEMELRRVNEELDLLVNSIASIIIGVSVKDRITHWNPFAEEVFGIKAGDIVGKKLSECGVELDWKRLYEAISTCITEDTMVRLDDVKYIRKDGKNGILGLTVNPLMRGGDVLEGFIILGRDLTERRILENQLQQARKLEAIGQLAAGVAHEINSPMQYVGDNLTFISKSYAGYRELLEKHKELILFSADYPEARQLVESIKEIEKKIDLQFLQEEMPRAITQSLEGVERISKIVKSMKAFAHPGTDRKIPADINQSIGNTITVSRNEWKYVAEVETEFDKDLPPVPCFAAELNQVILNMIVNATDAIREAREKKIIDRGIIRISTMITGGFTEIRVSDNGTGIPEEIRQKVFDPFFTTKEVGQGSGQGLPIAYAIIVIKHGGTLRFETETGRGTTFIIGLPLSETRQPASRQEDSNEE
jgi:PAS domain S-box-containing protein